MLRFMPHAHVLPSIIKEAFPHQQTLNPLFGVPSHDVTITHAEVCKLSSYDSASGESLRYDVHLFYGAGARHGWNIQHQDSAGIVSVTHTDTPHPKKSRSAVQMPTIERAQRAIVGMSLVSREYAPGCFINGLVHFDRYAARSATTSVSSMLLMLFVAPDDHA